MELPENIETNEHAIKLIDSNQSFYGSIYTLSLVELETLKIYIRTYLKTEFIWPFKSSARAPIFFDKKPSGSLYLCINYWGLNNLIIKNQYPLHLIDKFLDRLGWTKRFTQLDLTSAYNPIRIWEGNERKMAFCTSYDHFKYQVMPFRFANTPTSFQGYINKIFAKKLDIFVVVYVDDILIYTKDLDQSYVNVV